MYVASYGICSTILLNLVNCGPQITNLWPQNYTHPSTWHFSFYHNSGKLWQIFIIFALLETWINSLFSCAQIIHLTLIAFVFYLVKSENHDNSQKHCIAYIAITVITVWHGMKHTAQKLIIRKLVRLSQLQILLKMSAFSTNTCLLAFTPLVNCIASK